MSLRQPRVVLLACIGALLAGCSDPAMDESELVRVSLPGFSIELPTGMVTATTKEAFAGRHEVLLPSSGILQRLPLSTGRRARATVTVSWSRHGLDDVSYSSFIRGVALRSIPDSKVIREATLAPGTWVLTVGDAQDPATYAFQTCEPGFTVAVLVDIYTGADANLGLAKTIIRSVACSLTEANRTQPEVPTRLPPEFARVMSSKEPVYFSSDGETLSIGFNPGDLPGSPAFMELVGAQISQTMDFPPEKSVIKEIPVRVGNRQRRLVSAASGDIQFYAGAFWCPKLGMTVMATYVSKHPSDERARQVFDSIYCPGEPGNPPRDAKPILEDACAAGDSTACELLKTYSTQS